MREAERFEDMSPRGRLRVIQQDDGDMLVCVIEDMNSQGSCAGLTAGVEFCTSGGKSPKTLAALRALMQAMAEDNADRPTCHRRGERGLGVDEPAAQPEPSCIYPACHHNGCTEQCKKQPEQAQQPLTTCHAGRDGDCIHPLCPQVRDGEPRKSGRHCPLDEEEERC